MVVAGGMCAARAARCMPVRVGGVEADTKSGERGAWRVGTDTRVTNACGKCNVRAKPRDRGLIL